MSQRRIYLPAKTEEGQVESQESGHHMSDERAGLTGVQVEPEPEGHQQGEELAHYEVHLGGEQRDRSLGLMPQNGLNVPE